MSVAEVDRALSTWRQGDVLLAIDVPFVCSAHAGTPLSDAARAGAASGADPLLDVLTDEIGFVVLSQTCDVVRSAGSAHTWSWPRS